MKARDLAYETMRSINTNRARSLLTILGIVIGIGAVIAMTAFIGGVRTSLMGELGLDQSRLVYINVYPGREVTLDDVAAIADGVGDYEFVVPVIYGGGNVASATKQASGSFEGVTSEFYAATGLTFLAGRSPTAADDRARSRVVVLDQNGVRTLYGNNVDAAEVIGESVKIGNDSYAIVGVVETRSRYQSDYVELYVPFSTAVARITGVSSVDQILGFAREGADMDAVVSATETFLRAYFHLSDEDAEGALYIMSMQSIIDEVTAVTASFGLMMTAVASISLIVGGIGIMNMMLTNVTERIREIGLRKALGARRRDITRQFLLESVCLCLVGGAAGLLLGYAGAFVLSSFAGGLFVSDMGATITPVIDGGTVLLATSICVGIGIVFGYYPARRASRLDPVESLRYQ